MGLLKLDGLVQTNYSSSCRLYFEFHYDFGLVKYHGSRGFGPDALYEFPNLLLKSLNVVPSSLNYVI
jgi:hypothetical protein